MQTEINEQLQQQPRIEIRKEKKFIGKMITMSIVGNKTGELWRSFMPRRTEIKNNIGTAYYSIEVYEPDYFANFNPQAEFEKWATIEVKDFNNIPNGMTAITIPEGLYAVFVHKGPASKGPQTFQYIFGTWIPASEYEVDNRPHFEIMDEKTKGEDPSSEEELWIPIKLK